ncbi:MAG: DoxX family protein [Geminicoccaceae bacterium]
MTMTRSPAAASPLAAATAHYATATRWLGLVPQSLMLLLLRIGVAMVFWKSGMTKIESWESTVFLFAEEYRVPLLPPEIAAYLGTAVELGGSVALILGFATRFAALALIGLVAVIQLFVYPALWTDHIFWFAALLILLARGAGLLSIDALIARFAGHRET